ncbi:hypothetical protein P5673_032362 [Acropora cervicornis]|uniref:Uncharacterized protein n=1 Tax=Acropora cervicornis TaxID=6130 RepID=A0AAD9URV5_ACRCE|nr:hypothetical protein P5673_032362 [Acropora cervicornis]
MLVLAHSPEKEDKRAVRDCYNNLARELTKKIKNEEKPSSIETEKTNLEKDLIEREDAAESEKREADDQKKQDRENAADNVREREQWKVSGRQRVR